MKIFTLGYEKKTIDQFIEILKRNNVTTLVDTRQTAWSYKRDFCKTRLTEALSQHGICYRHIRKLGNPKQIRRTSSSVKEILVSYRRHLTSTEDGISELIGMLEEMPTGKYACLTCFEQDYECCHRSVITDFLKQKINSLRIVHL